MREERKEADRIIEQGILEVLNRHPEQAMTLSDFMLFFPMRCTTRQRVGIVIYNMRNKGLIKYRDSTELIPHYLLKN